MNYSIEDHEKYLNELHKHVTICGMHYMAGYALKKIDLVAFSVSYSERLAELVENATQKVKEKAENLAGIDWSREEFVPDYVQQALKDLKEGASHENLAELIAEHGEYYLLLED